MTQDEIDAGLQAAKQQFAEGKLPEPDLDTLLRELAEAQAALRPDETPEPVGDEPGFDVYDRVGAAVAAGLRAFFEYGND